MTTDLPMLAINTIRTLSMDAVEKARSRLETFNLQSLIKEALRVLT